MIGSETINHYLARLSAREPTPGGGAAGALHAAQGAALVAMVAGYTTGPKYAEHEKVSLRIAARAKEMVQAALQLADDDEAVFAAVIAAYKLPAATPDGSRTRSRAIQEATVAAAVPPGKLIRLAAEIVTLGRELAGFSNPNVISDVAAAAEAARAAAGTALITLDINISAIDDAETADALHDDVLRAEDAIRAAQSLAEMVREKVTA